MPPHVAPSSWSWLPWWTFDGKLGAGNIRKNQFEQKYEFVVRVFQHLSPKLPVDTLMLAPLQRIWVCVPVTAIAPCDEPALSESALLTV